MSLKGAVNPLKLTTLTQYIFFALTLTITVSACTQEPVYPSPLQQGSDIIVDTTGLAEDTPVFYSYRSGKKTVNFFVLKLHDKVLSFADACATCYTHKRGYRAEDDVVVCRSCNQRFSVYKLEKGVGGCFPLKIAGRMEKNRYVIPVSALEAMTDKF